MEEDIVVEKQPKLWLAILAAIGMGLVGCVLWGILYYLGVIAWIAAYAVVLLACWAYKKFNLKMDKKGYIIITVIAVIEVVLTMLITINIAVMVELANEGLKVGFFECFGYVFEVIGADATVKSAVIVDAVLSLIFVGAGILTYYFIEKKKTNTENKSLTDAITITDAPTDKENSGDETTTQPVNESTENKEDKKDN